MVLNSFILSRYVIIFSIFVLIHSTSEVGGMLVTLRCVDPKDKAMALGLISGAIGLFGESKMCEWKHYLYILMNKYNTDMSSYSERKSSLFLKM